MLTIPGETVCPSEDVLGVHQINVQPEDEDELHAESEPQNVRVRVEEVLVRVFYFESVPRAVHRGSPSNQHCARLGAAGSEPPHDVLPDSVGLGPLLLRTLRHVHDRCRGVLRHPSDREGTEKLQTAIE